MKINNWISVPFGIICESIQPGFASGKHNSDGNGTPHLRPMNVDRNGRINLDVIKCIQESEAEPLKRGDILFNNTNSRELVGKTGLIKADTEFAFSNHMTRIRLLKNAGSPQFYSTFLHYLFQNGFFKERCSNHVNQSSIGKSFLENEIEAHLPPLAEQHRIVAKIEELFSNLDAGIASLKKAKEQLKIYRQSVLKWAFEGKLTSEWRTQHSHDIDAKWYQVSLKDMLSAPLINGRSVPTKKNGSPVLRLTAIRGKYIDLNQTKEGDWSGFNPSAYEVTENDFLVSRGNGTLELVGRGAVVGKNVKVAFPDTMIRIRLSGRISLDYFYWVWNSRLIRTQIEKAAKTTAGIYKINQANIEAIRLPLMSLIEQSEIVSEIESRLSEADNLDKALDAALAQSESLRQSILKQAFAGKLVPQDPNDEPAEKLLERIRAERAASEETPKKRGRYGGGSRSETRSVAEGPGTPVEGGAPKPRRGRPPGKQATAAKRRG